MDKLLAGLKLEHWYHVFVLLGAAGALASLTVPIQGIENRHALLVSLGVFFWGTGEWINHPFRTRIAAPGVYGPGWAKIEGHPRNAKPLGLLFDAIGLLLLAIGVYKVASAA